MSTHGLHHSFRLFFALGIGLFLTQCEGDQNKKNKSFSQIEHVLTASLSALPQLQQDIDLNNLFTIDVPTADNDGDQALIEQLNQWLAFECHLPNTTMEINYCADDVSLLSSNTYTAQTLQGMIATAFEKVFEVYPNDKSYQRCENSIYTSEIVGEGAFTPEDTRDLSLLQEDIWTCLENRKSNNSSQTYTLFSQATDQTTYALTHVSLDEQTSTYHTHALVDMYARKNQTSDDIPTIIAWNIIHVQEAQNSDGFDQNSRLILILNTQTGNYIGKYGAKQREGLSTSLYTPSQDWVILGRGGFDVVSQLFTQGQIHFRGRLINPNQETYYSRQYCIFNDASPSFGATENCIVFEDELTDFFDHNDGFWDSQTMVEFLNLTSDDQSELALWSQYLDGSSWLELNDLPNRSDFPTSVSDDTTEDRDSEEE